MSTTLFFSPLSFALGCSEVLRTSGKNNGLGNFQLIIIVDQIGYCCAFVLFLETTCFDSLCGKNSLKLGYSMSLGMFLC